jgi:hypothetical protein
MRSHVHGAIALGLLLLATPLAAQVRVNGFVEGAWGVRTALSPLHDGAQDYTLEETRAQVRLQAIGDVGEAFVRLDALQDHLVGDGTELELREGFFRFTTLAGHLDVKAGRQALTWGTGDLVFVNDLFPKDWESFFAGRDDPYLKAPADVVRLGFFGLPFDVDVVLSPEFTPDRLPAPGGRFSIDAPEGVLPPAEVGGGLGDGELAVRLSRYVGDATASFYGYVGHTPTPQAVRPVEGSTELEPWYPRLNVWGASLRGANLGGVTWIEGGYYDSRADPDGSRPEVPNSSVRYLAGHERQLATDFNVTAQYYGEWMQDHAAAEAAPGVTDPGDELRHLVTLRLEKRLHYQTVRLSLFTFYSPTDEDAHARALASYQVSDEVEVALGANVFEAREEGAGTFAPFDRDDNVFVRLRYTY